MGEVNVKLTITNMVDEVLARRGVISANEIRRKIVDAVVDTGAVMTTMPEYLVEELGLTIWGTKKVFFADDREKDVEVTEGVRLEAEGRSAVIETLVVGSKVLLGQTFLETTDLLVDCNNRKLLGAHGSNPLIAIR